MKSMIYIVVIALKRIATTSLLCLAAFFAAIDLSGAATNETVRFVLADLRQKNGPLDTMFKRCVGAGRANEGLRADWQRQLAYAHRECGFEYIRMHGLFCDDMGVYREDSQGNPEYNWQYIDELYDFLRSIGMKPFVELGFMPNALASDSKTIFWWKGKVTPPKGMKKWADFIRAFVLHEQQRCGDDEVRTWYFEVWNEPNLTDGYWTGTQQQYFDLYAATDRQHLAQTRARGVRASFCRRLRARRSGDGHRTAGQPGAGIDCPTPAATACRSARTSFGVNPL